MNLTKSDREAFVRAVLDDVPQIDYNELAKKKAQDALVAAMPGDVRLVYIQNRHWLKLCYTYTPDGIPNVHLYSESGENILRDSFPELWKELSELGTQANAQARRLREMETKLTGVIYGCRTLKQAKDRLPEFEKYLPRDRDGTGVTNLPAVANLVTDLMNLGWPKGAEAA